MNFGVSSGTGRLRRSLAWAVSLLILVSGLVALSPPAPAKAANPANFDPSYLISDANFYDGNAMTEGEIQAFLASKGSALTTYRSNVPSRAARPSVDIPGVVYCAAFQGGNNLLASTLIFRAQQACGVSARVLLATLQKESRMVVGGDPANFNAHMGFGCPDTAPCNETYYGLGNQLYLASLHFKFYQRPENNYRYQVGNEYVQYHPNAACGGTTLNIKNWATAALYNYTPYQPDAAALAAYPAASNACGAYGNRNFWFFYSDWFGSPTGPINPVGTLEAVTSTPSTVRVAGWALDHDTPNSLDLHVYVDGTFAKFIQANRPRSDINAAFPGMPGNYGFDTSFAVAPGSRNVCVYAINVGPGSVNTQLGCRRVVVAAPPPVEPAATELAAVYRFWSSTYNAHFYTRSVAERNDVIKNYSDSVWKYEAAVFGAYGTQVEGTVPLYRFWSSTYNGHFYTTSEGEKNEVIALYPDHIWKYEAVAFYVYPNASSNVDTVPMARFWSPTYKHHFYTADAGEAKQVTDLYSDEIWTPEGDVFRVARSVPKAAPLP